MPSCTLRLPICVAANSYHCMETFMLVLFMTFKITSCSKHTFIIGVSHTFVWVFFIKFKNTYGRCCKLHSPQRYLIHSCFIFTTSQIPYCCCCIFTQITNISMYSLNMLISQFNRICHKQTGFTRIVSELYFLSIHYAYHFQTSIFTYFTCKIGK